MTPSTHNKILISACLLGRKVRYDGGHCFQENTVLATWAAQGRLVPLCPEMAGGLPTPRPAAEIVGGSAERFWQDGAAVHTRSGQNVTAAFKAGAEAALALALEHQVALAILKEKSPSCGVMTTYDGTFSGVLTPGPGVTAALLRDHGIPIFSEHQLGEAAAFLASRELC